MILTGRLGLLYDVYECYKGCIMLLFWVLLWSFRRNQFWKMQKSDQVDSGMELRRSEVLTPTRPQTTKNEYLKNKSCDFSKFDNKNSILHI